MALPLPSCDKILLTNPVKPVLVAISLMIRKQQIRKVKSLHCWDSLKGVTKLSCRLFILQDLRQYFFPVTCGGFFFGMFFYDWCLFLRKVLFFKYSRSNYCYNQLILMRLSNKSFKTTKSSKNVKTKKKGMDND